MERPAEPFVLVSRRHLRSNNTWLHNVSALMKGRDRCTLLIYPDDAARCGITDTDIVTVKSEAGEIKVPVEITDSIKPGGVSTPRLGARKPGTRMSVANNSPGREHHCAVPADVYRRALRQRGAQRHPGHDHRRSSPIPTCADALR
jgi:anaerobic selenocysteine-containing dehydrogenase